MYIKYHNIHLYTYFLTSLFYAACDHFYIFANKKINKYPTSADYLDASPRVITNLLIDTLVIVFFPLNYTDVFPLEEVAVLLFLVIFGDIIFYTTHRFLHTNKYLYNSIHSIHHKHSNPFAYAGFDSYFMEHILTNLLSVMLPLYCCSCMGLLSSNMCQLWLFYTTLSVCISHSGYNLGCWQNCDAHNNHHKYYTCNYGFGFYIGDRIAGTYR